MALRAGGSVGTRAAIPPAPTKGHQTRRQSLLLKLLEGTTLSTSPFNGKWGMTCCGKGRAYGHFRRVNVGKSPTCENIKDVSSGTHS